MAAVPKRPSIDASSVGFEKRKWPPTTSAAGIDHNGVIPVLIRYESRIHRIDRVNRYDKSDGSVIRIEFSPPLPIFSSECHMECASISRKTQAPFAVDKNTVAVFPSRR
jgi:hypothetical protein